MTGVDLPGLVNWTDSHCHVQDKYLETKDELDAVLARAAAAGVDRLICIGTGHDTSTRALEIALEQAALGRLMWPTIGLHPHDAIEGLAPIGALLAAAMAGGDRPRRAGEVVAVGECGLDYHYDHSPREVQRRVFAEQIELAKRYELTLVVHTREAWEDTFAVLDEMGPPERLVLHCFTGGPTEAARCLELGAFLSFSGIVTFKNADEVRAAARICPVDRLLVETDAPFLAPVPHRGAQNEPAFVSLVGLAMAELLDLDPAAVALATSANAVRAFDLAV